MKAAGTTPRTIRCARIVACSLIASVALLSTACSNGSSDSTDESLEVSSSEAPTFQADDVDPITAPDRWEKVEDTGLHVEFELQSTTSGAAGGSIITVKVHNLNETALPVDALGEPTLTLSDGTTVDRMDAAASGIDGQDSLDLPLGKGASTNMRYAFNVAPGNLYNASFSLGNVTWKGDISA